MPRDRTPRLIVALVLLLFILGPLLSNGVSLLVNWIWFKQLGFDVLYVTKLKAQVWLSTFAGISFVAFVALNLLIAKALARRQGLHAPHNIIEFPLIDRMTQAFNWVIGLGVLIIGYMVSQWASTHWFNYLLAGHAASVGSRDPLFGYDIGFYLFVLPYHWFLYHFAMATVIITAIATGFVYVLEGGISMGPQGASVARIVRTHLLALGGVLFLILAYRARLAMYGLLTAPHSVLYGADYADVHATLPGLKMVLVLCILTGAAFFLASVTGRLRPAVVSVLVLVAAAFVGVTVWPGIIQKLVVTPDQLDKEMPYITRNIQGTRQAYALDRFEVSKFPASANLTLADVQQNEATVHNVRLWDHLPLMDTYSQLQEMRAYYSFSSIDTDRYWIDGKYRQVLLSARELSTPSLPDPTWVNQHLIYTHGYGVVLNSVNDFTPDGLPKLLISNIPPEFSTSSLKIAQPAIYFGEKSNNYCLVKTRQQEFDYPLGGHDVYTTYQGSGGIPIKNFWRRLLFTLYYGQKNILFSTEINSSSRIMIHRRILNRASRLAPFLVFDPNPYIVIRKDGSLDWVLDAYTVSTRYPYSNPTASGVNYMRNSVKATVNAYSGRVTFYVSDPTDPIIRTYERIYPGVFHPLSEMPEDLLAHIRYPQLYFSVQAGMYATYHMTDPRVFYNKEDLWHVARSNARGPGAPMVPYYAIMKLAEIGQTEEFILMVPFTPPQHNNMVAWMAARCDAPNYGKVIVFEFPKQKLVYGPQQIESRIDQDPRISEQLTLWGQGGSTVIRGTLLVIPVMHSILYIEPLYLAASAGGALPQLKRVIVAYSDHVVMARTLDDALASIFGGVISSPSGTAGAAPSAAKGQAGVANVRTLAQTANREYTQAQNDLRDGNWAGYGAEMNKLQQTLQQLAAASGKEK